MFMARKKKTRPSLTNVGVTRIPVAQLDLLRDEALEAGYGSSDAAILRFVLNEAVRARNGVKAATG